MIKLCYQMPKMARILALLAVTWLGASLAWHGLAKADSAGDYLILTIGKSASGADKQVKEQIIGDVVIKLRPDIAPSHVARIKQLVADKAYDHVVFHRVIEGFMAQTGDVKFGNKESAGFNPELVGQGGSSYPNLKAEFSKEPFERGTVGMARAFDPNSANSQFFICFAPAAFLNGQYTVIGQVVKGMEFVDKIKKGDQAKNGSVSDPDEIIKAKISDKA